VAKPPRPDSGALAADEETIAATGDPDSDVDDDAVPNLETIQTRDHQQNGQLNSTTTDSAETLSTAVIGATATEQLASAAADLSALDAASTVTNSMLAAAMVESTATPAAVATDIPVNGNAACQSAAAVLDSDSSVIQHNTAEITTPETVVTATAAAAAAVVDSSATTQIPVALLSRLSLVSEAEPQSSLFLHHEEEGEGFIEDSYYNSLRPAAASCHEPQLLPSLNLASLGPDEGDSMVGGLVSGKNLELASRKIVN
jgi:hypothetical protein